MKPVPGPVSNRLRAKYGNNVGRWPAARPDDAKPMPESGVEGHEIPGRASTRPPNRPVGVPPRPPGHPKPVR